MEKGSEHGRQARRRRGKVWSRPEEKKGGNKPSDKPIWGSLWERGVLAWEVSKGKRGGQTLLIAEGGIAIAKRKMGETTGHRKKRGTMA